MTTESMFRAAFWIPFAGVLAMRIYFALQVRQAGERVMPDRDAVEREGRAMFAVRFVMFLIFLSWLVHYAINPPWLKVLSVHLPSWLRWTGFALGLRLPLEKSGRLGSNYEENTIWWPRDLMPEYATHSTQRQMMRVTTTSRCRKSRRYLRARPCSRELIPTHVKSWAQPLFVRSSHHGL